MCGGSIFEDWESSKIETLWLLKIKLLFLGCIMVTKLDDQVFEDILDLEIIVIKSAPETFLTSKIKSNCLKWLF